MKYFNFKFLIFFLALAMAIPPAWATTTDVITASDLAATSTSLAYFTNVSKPSGAVYAGRTAKHSSGAIILTTQSANAGIVSTTSGGKIKSVTFTFNQNTDKYGIQVYGKNTAYSSSSDLTDASTRGTLLGTTNSSSTVITVTDDYEYIGIISNNTSSSSKIILDDIQFEWEANGPKLEVGVESLTINDSGSNNSFSVTGSGLIDNVGLSRSSSSITPSLSTTVGSAVNNDNGNWYFIHNDGSLTGTVAATYEGRELTATDIFTLGTNKNNDGEDITIPVEVTYQPNIYVIGNFGNAGWQYGDGSHPMTYSKDGNTITYTATLENVPANSYIMFTRNTGETYYWEGDYNRLFFGAETDGGDWGYGTNTSGNLDTDPTDENPVKYHPIYFSEAGNYTITINATAKTFSITKVLPQVATPVISPESGNFTEAQQVTITCETSGATIYYTTDGSTPTTSSTAYSAPFTVSETTTVKAIAVLNGYTDSEVATATYTINTIPSGQEQTITIGDESTYTDFLPVYGTWYDANQRNQIIYTAKQLGWEPGTVVKAITFYPRSTLGISEGNIKVSLGTTTSTWQTSGSYYVTVDGPIEAENLVDVAELEPDPNTTGAWIINFTTPFTYYGDNLLVEINTTAGIYKACSFYAQTQGDYAGYYSYNSSKNVTKDLPMATFTFIPGDAPEQVATPTFNPAEGTYTSAQSVTISCATEGATIYYTTDGTAPTTASTQYSGAITVSETMTINAIAVKDEMADSEIASATYTIDIPIDYAVTVSPNGGDIAFGTVNPENNESTTRTITVTNTGLQPVTPTLTALTAPFSTDYTPVQLASGESVTITVTFAPTEEGTFSSEATLSLGNGIADCVFTLTGKGGKYDENDHSALYDHDYTWVDDNGNEHINNLLDVATDPNQIIAMLREIYITPEIPGNKLRGFTEDGADESLTINGNNAYAVNYSAVGQLNSTLQYTDTYGWNIPTQKSVLSVTKGGYTYNYMDPTEYEPNEEGLTLIMVEIKDGANYSGSSYYSFTNSTLKEKVANTFKSARIITTYKKSGSGEEAGTLFKIDADKLNRFFFLAKGQLRLIDHSQASEKPWTSTNVVPYPSLKVKGSSYTFTDNTFNSSANSAVLAPFEHMFEQFSPNQASSATSAMTDVYQELVNMESYEVVHDCVSIPFVGGNHEFNMYGVDSESDDCQDVRDMMFFVPDYRMKYWAESQYSFGDATRDPSSDEKFVNYNKDHRPTLGLYVIHQNEITGDKQDNANVYDLNLSWKSNLLDFLPADEGQYFLYRVITDANGNKSYEPVVQVTESGEPILDANGDPIPVTLDPNQTTYVDHIAMQETGQEVTYVVQGQDATQFLSLQMSNEESFIIPGTDETLKLTLKLTNDYSRFDPKTERNYYSNELQVTNNMSPYVSADDLAANNAQFNIYRYYGEGENEVEIPVATLTPVAGQMKLNITWANQRGNSTDAENYYSWINMPNADNVTYSVNNNNVVAFDNFRLFDNFYESVADNNHPSQYRYQVEFSYGDQTAHSNKVSVYIHKTDMDVQGYTQSNIDNDDLDHSLDATARYIDEQVKYSSKQEILRYDAFRWKEGSENELKIMTNSTIDATTLEVTDTEVAPTGEADNGGNQYTLKMDGNTQGAVGIDLGDTKPVTFMDAAVNQEAGMYYYAPVVETFTGRSDYNTYGAPVQQTGVATIQAKVAQAVISEGSFKVGNEPTLYAHYNVTLDLSQLLIPSEDDPFKDYDLYKVRVWRQVDVNLLNEEVFSGNNVGRNRAERITGDFLMEEVNNNTSSDPCLGREGVHNDLCISDYKLGSNENLTQFHSNWTKSGSNEIMGTFGAKKLRSTVQEGDSVIDELPMHFIVRAYYTRTANLEQASNGRGVDVTADSKYYIAEYQFDYTLTRDNTATGLSNVIVDRKVTSVTYYNLMGQQSSKPFEGVNIVVTRYSDGTTSTAKVIQ